MSLNKYKTKYKESQSKKYKLIHKGLYNDEMSFEGDARQIITYILNQQL